MAYNLGTSLFASILTAHEKFVFQKGINILKTVMSPMVTYIFLLLGYRSIAMSIISVGFTVLTDTIYAVYCIKKLKVRFDMKNPQKAQLLEIASFSGFIAISAIVDQVNWSIDKLILGRFKGSASTAVYSVAAQINTIYMQISTGVSNVFVPRINRMVAEECTDEQLTELFIKIGRVQLMILLPIIIGFTCLGKCFINIWTPDGYGEAFYIALLLMVPATIPYIQNAGISIQTAMAKHKFRAGLYLGMAGINLLLSILLCQKYGGIGCAIGTALSLIIANGVIMNIYYHKVICLNVILFWRKMLQLFLPATLMGVTGIIITRVVTVNSYFVLLISAIVMMAVYIAMLWVFALNSSEKNLILSFVKRK